MASKKSAYFLRLPLEIELYVDGPEKKTKALSKTLQFTGHSHAH
jgi:hypothetical protein